MRTSIFKRTLCLVLSFLMILPIIPFGFFSIFAAETEMDLTDLEYEEYSAIAGEFRVDSNLTIGQESYERGIYMHPTGAGDAYASFVTYNITGLGATRFTSWVGKDSAGGNWGNNPVKFEVYADSKLIGSSAELQYPNKELLNVQIPEGTSTLKILAKATGPDATSYYSCGCTLGTPKLFMDGGSVGQLQKETSLTDLPYGSVICLFGATNPTTTNVEGEFRYNNNITIGTQSYEKGVYLHPVAQGAKASVTYDISGGTYDKFKTYVGKDQGGAAWDNQPVKFDIIIDDVVMATADQMKHPESKLLECDVPEGAKKLTLQVTAISSHSATGSCFGNPVLISKAQAGELIITKKPLGYEVFPIGEYTFKGLSNAQEVRLYVDEKLKSTVSPTETNPQWSITVNFDKKENHIIKIASVIDGQEIMSETFDYIMNDDVIYASFLPVTSYTSYPGQYKVFKGSSGLSIGGGAYTSSFGFQNHPNAGDASSNYGAVDINIDISGLGYTYFRTVVGKMDIGGTGFEYIVLVDDVVLAKASDISGTEMAALACEIPAGAEKLTLRSTNYNEDFFNGLSGWCDPILARDRTMIENYKAMYDETATTETFDLTNGIGVQFRANYPFDSIIIPKTELLSNATEVTVYKFTGSYFETTKRSPIFTMLTSNSEFDGVISTGAALPEGEYLVILKGDGAIKAFESDEIVIYNGKEAVHGAPEIKLSFVGEASGDLFTKVVASVGDGSAPSNTPDKTERANAKAEYESYLAENLKNFPITMTIGGMDYSGFGDSSFTLVSQTSRLTDKNGDELTSVIEYTPKDRSLAKVTFTVISTYYADYAAYDWTVYFENKDPSKNTPIISNINSKVRFKGSDPYVFGTSGDTGGSGGFSENNFSVTDIERIIAPMDGRSTNGVFPYWNLEYGTGGALIAVGWAGQWQASYQKAGSGESTVTTFINGQQTFKSYLKPGEKARTPLTAIVQYEGRNPDRATNLWRRFMVDCNMPKVSEDNTTVKPMILGTTHEYFNEMTWTNENEQLESFKHFVESGADIDMWWMDAGWYYGADGKTDINGNWWNTGSWVIDTVRFPNGLTTIAEYAKQNGMGTMLWFEPERVGNPEKLATDGSTLKPEWVLSEYAGAFGSLVDYSNAETVDWLIERICSILDSIDAKVYREDFNMSPLPVWMSINEENPDRQGITENLHIQGHFRLWDAIAERFPGIILDSCASGGRRNDLESMRRAVPLHRTDNQYGNSPLQQCYTWGYAEWIPYFGSKADTDGGNGDVEKTKYADKYALRRALVPSMELNYSPYDPIDWYKVQDACEEQRYLSEYYLKDYYQLTGFTMNESDWMAWQYFNSEEGHGYANIWRRTEADATETIFLKGLKSDVMYDIWFEDQNRHQVISGNSLMYDGINVTLPARRSNDIMYISEVGNGRYIARNLTVKITEPSVGRVMGQLGAAINESLIGATKYDSFALRFNMSIRDTVLNITHNDGEGYIESGVENSYANLITVNGTRLSDIISNVKMDYDVFHNVLTVYIKQGSIEGFGMGNDNTVTVDKSLATFENVSLSNNVTFSLTAESKKWEEKALTPEAPEFKLDYATLALSNDIAVRYYTKLKNIEGFENVKLTVTSEYSGTVELFHETVTVDGIEYAVFTFAEIAPSRAGDNITAVLSGTKNGEVVIDETLNYSPKTYCMNQIEASNDTKLVTLCKDLLNFCADTQMFVGYKTDALVNAGIDKTNTTYNFSNVFELNNQGGVKIISAGLFLTSSVRIRFTVESDKIITAKVNGKDAEVVNAGNGKYFIYYDATNVTEYTKNIELAVSNGSTTSNLTYSAATYALRQIENGAPSMAACESFLKYIASVENWIK